jgi:hypothetical protein
MSSLEQAVERLGSVPLSEVVQPIRKENSNEHTEISDEEWVIAVKFFRELGVWPDHLGRRRSAATKRFHRDQGTPPLDAGGFFFGITLLVSSQRTQMAT